VPSFRIATEVPSSKATKGSSVEIVKSLVAALLVSEAVPVPAALTADTRNVYVVLFASPVTVVDAVVEVPSVNVVHVEPLSDEYSTV
jgi:hypothetical protein